MGRRRDRKIGLHQVFAAAVLMLLGASYPAAGRTDDVAWNALREGAIVLFRHANAPGTGDPDGFKLGDCATQRNLDAVGRDQARAIGAAFAAQGIQVGAVLASQWCRARETAELAFPGMVRDEPAFNSFFSDRSAESAQTERARGMLASWAGRGALVVVTHQVNITALTGIVPTSGEGIVISVADDGTFSLVSRIEPADE
jgi:phosphohistidine phosphatase SixA